jgi:guanylate kinase
MGKSGSGKDTLLANVLRDPRINLSPVVPYTTRPMREGERDGEDYRFVTVAEMDEMARRGEILESRTYRTMRGDWHYFTRILPPDDGRTWITITTPAAIPALAAGLGAENIALVYMDIRAAERFERCYRRERRERAPNYSELCRRYLADEEDFAEDVLAEFERKYAFYRIDANGDEGD